MKTPEEIAEVIVDHIDEMGMNLTRDYKIMVIAHVIAHAIKAEREAPRA